MQERTETIKERCLLLDAFSEHGVSFHTIEMISHMIDGKPWQEAERMALEFRREIEAGNLK